jgi:hypothetical protein
MKSALIVALAVTTSVASSQPIPASGPGKGEAIGAAAKAGEPQPFAPTAAKVPLPAPKADDTQKHAEAANGQCCGSRVNDERTWEDYWKDKFREDPIVSFTLVLAIVTSILAIDTKGLRRATNGLLRAAHRDNILAHPPRINITNVRIYSDPLIHEPPRMIPGAKIFGEAYAVNAGRADARMDGNEVVFCEIYWHSDKLPMWRPYNDPHKHQRLSSFFVDEGTKEIVRILKPGQFAMWELKTEVPTHYTQALYLYVMGVVVYRDEIGTRRARLFCRRYDPTRQGFVTMADCPDYEGEE